VTTHADFTEEEWDTVLEGPTSAGMIVTTAERGGTFREVMAMAKAFAEARQDHGSSELLDEIVAHRPETDRTKAHSSEELKEHGLQKIRDAVALVSTKATPAELGDYRLFVVSLAKKVAGAKKEKGSTDGVSPAEATAIGEIEAALGI
jgi:recombination DNA repair RAD52 pathway protein